MSTRSRTRCAEIVRWSLALSLALVFPSLANAQDWPSDISIIPANSTAAAQSASTVTAAEVTETPTFFYAFQRYEENYWGPKSPWNGLAIDGVALRTDNGHTVWWIVYGVWDNDIVEDWEILMTHADGSKQGLHWHTQMMVHNGVLQKCFISSDPVTGTVRGMFCADDPNYGKASGTRDILFGYTHTTSSSSPVEVITVTLTHNAPKIWETPYLVSELHFVNPVPWYEWPVLVDGSGHLTTNLSAIVSAPANINSTRFAATDGVTPLFVRVGSTPDIPVTVKIAGDSTDDGTLVDLYGSGGPTSAQLSLQPLDNASFGAALYTVPPKFSPYSSSLEMTRLIQIEIDYLLPWQGHPGMLTLPLTLFRTPLLLVHGMWSNPDAWAALNSHPFISGLRPTYTVNWSPADTSLPNNVNAVRNGVNSVLSSLRNQGAAVTQMDIVAHSAGGPLFRLYAQSSNYRRPSNFMRGDFRKTLTIGSPHHGTPIADFVQSLRANANPIVVSTVQFAFAQFGHSITKGIISDLQTTSATMTGIQPTPGRAHAWIGDLPSLSNSTGEETPLWNLLSWICSTKAAQKSVAQCAGGPDKELLRDRVFSFQVNDGLVAHDMQAGGLVGSATTTLSNTAHTRETQAVSPAEVAGILDDTSGYLDDGGFR